MARTREKSAWLIDGLNRGARKEPQRTTGQDSARPKAARGAKQAGGSTRIRQWLAVPKPEQASKPVAKSARGNGRPTPRRPREGTREKRRVAAKLRRVWEKPVSREELAELQTKLAEAEEKLAAAEEHGRKLKRELRAAGRSKAPPSSPKETAKRRRSGAEAKRGSRRRAPSRER